MGLSKADKTWLSQHFGENVVFDEPMHRHTSFHIGGPADALVKPSARQSLTALINWCRSNDLSCFILGKGTNLLVKDNGIRGIVICLEAILDEIRHVKIDDNTIRVTAMAGASLPRLCRYAMDNGFSGLNFAVGIPGSAGGAVMMNAGTATGCMGDIIDGLTIMSFSGEMEKIAKEHLNFSYRKFSISPGARTDAKAPLLILEVDILLKPGDSEALKIDARKKLQHRKTTQPVSMFSPGCIFRNPETGWSAGRLIDEAGLKGRRIGDAEVSTKHANYIVNHGNATAEDVMALMQWVGDQVYEKHHIRLEPEVIIVGE